jgi:putative ABC transport system permease protein
MILPPEQMKAWLATRTGAIVGPERTAERFGWKIGDKVPINPPSGRRRTATGPGTFDIVGIYDGKDKGTDTTPLFFRYDYFDEARGQEVGARDRSAGTPSASRIRRRRRKWPSGWTRNLKIRPAETKTEPEGAFIQGWAKQIGNIVLIVAAILARCSSPSCW